MKGAAVFAGLLPLHADAPTLWHGLTNQALPLILVPARAAGGPGQIADAGGADATLTALLIVVALAA